jgi:type I restriction enzyme S subunit
MIGGLKPYPAMKHSGVPWRGEVPAAWEVRKLRGIIHRVTERNRSDLPLLSVVRERGVIRRDTTAEDENRNFIPDDLSNYKVVRPGQFAMNKMKAWQGSYGVSAHEGIVSPAYFVFDLAGVEGRFFHTAIRSRAYVPSFAQASDGVRIGQWDLSEPRMREIPFAIPPLAEQAAIVRFLDHADRRIRRYIRAKQKLIKLLEEQKQAIIHRAVTRGLDPNVRLKPSGVEWLGDVPEHWDVLRCRYIFREVDKRSADGSEQHLSMSQRLGLVPSDLVENRTLVSESYAGGKLCEVGDLVLNRLKAHLGVFALARHAGVISPDYTVLRPVDSTGIEYFERVLRSPAFRHELRVRAKGIVEGFWRLYTDDFYEIRLPVPPPQERDAIVAYFVAETATVEQAVLKAEREIALLREYRTRLIADVVTGKLDVREAVARLPQEAEELEPLDETEALGEMEGEAAADDLEPESQEAKA